VTARFPVVQQRAEFKNFPTSSCVQWSKSFTVPASFPRYNKTVELTSVEVRVNLVFPSCYILIHSSYPLDDPHHSFATTVSQHNTVTTVSQHNSVTTQHCHNTTLSQHNSVTTQQCHNSKCVIFQESLLNCYNYLWVQRRHNCSPAASFANCVMTLYLLKVHLQKFLSIPITQKCQILSCVSLLSQMSEMFCFCRIVSVMPSYRT